MCHRRVKVVLKSSCKLVTFSQSPIAYAIVQMVAFGGSIFVNTICFGVLIRYNNIDRSLPARPQDYGAFIMESRALQDYMVRQKTLTNRTCIAKNFGWVISRVHFENKSVLIFRRKSVTFVEPTKRF